ncbi:MAG: SAM-dependent methyltransferase [Chloroflexi bacterium]|nr:SAM-dependent methyltransferase [Chloroflexota bacterium]
MQFDLTRPNNGRMIDYWLGGSHNFEIDRHFADQVGEKLPVVRQSVFENRALVKLGVDYMYARGIRVILDFGAALPTCENTHIVAHRLDPNIKVVYSDNDAVTVAYGQELLQGNPNAAYLQCDAAAPADVLESPVTRGLIGDERRVGIMFLALGHLMTDQDLRQAWQRLYDGVAPGSYMFVSHASENWNTDPELIAVTQVYSSAKVKAYYRSSDEIRELAKPWQVTPEGIVDYRYWNRPVPAEPGRQYGYAMMVHN